MTLLEENVEWCYYLKPSGVEPDIFHNLGLLADILCGEFNML